MRRALGFTGGLLPYDEDQEVMQGVYLPQVALPYREAEDPAAI
jgi:hypothetical protein